jgi:hypothetical protein
MKYTGVPELPIDRHVEDEGAKHLDPTAALTGPKL